MVSGCCSFGKQVWCCQAEKMNHAELFLVTLRGRGGSMVCPAGSWGCIQGLQLLLLPHHGRRTDPVLIARSGTALFSESVFLWPVSYD